MQIDVATRADDELYEAFQRLVPQLTSNNPPPTQGELVALIQEPSSTLLLARADDGGIVGALNLTVYRVPTGVRSIIEDVIVDTSARGRGVGQALMKRAIELAKEKGAKNIALTSNPARAAANRLYVKLGFKKRETNAYQLNL
ncbi:MAG: GNAT family N-acetyltransferase [Chloroflexi bacterium]|nr:GNAT family N-acetyltransferase [Chloroflexi bacterium CFX1]MCK6566413.1 GNAT family N-acetyltransferase [Anaerolineales bacterium]MCQ3951665.1 GNAT family N-acetyltransferase [Chloroflexota bacterium]MDL1919027.1 GNAT family N-acetyltransferase [Chloroflexi bacterium CFX5]NUQ57817.1 GNAT family N-acetyltransferase [Anaerolineales bacterium]